MVGTAEDGAMVGESVEGADVGLNVGMKKL